jgi:hypothetical protein
LVFSLQYEQTIAEGKAKGRVGAVKPARKVTRTDRSIHRLEANNSSEGGGVDSKGLEEGSSDSNERSEESLEDIEASSLLASDTVDVADLSEDGGDELSESLAIQVEAVMVSL